MVEHAPQAKHDEQFPLLKVDGGGDGTINQTSPIIVAPGWNATRSSKRQWLDRWPEFVSALWITGILLGISFFAMYAVSLGTIRRHPVVILKCNETMKSSNQVYYYHIVQFNSFVPFLLYSKYLADMATQYPFLHFNVFFLLDDSFQSAFCRRSKFFSKIYYPSPDYSYKFDKLNLQGLRDFQKRYKNVNITVMSMSKYMAMTPLKHKWRNIPVYYLPFYARVFSIWQNSGIALDLATFNFKYNRRQGIDRKISAILQQHNDGINPEKYKSSLNYVKREEEYEFFSMFCGLINQILNDTRAFFNATLPFSTFSTENESELNTSLVRTHRNKRDVMNNKNNIKNDTGNNMSAAVVNTSGLNTYSSTDFISTMKNIINNTTIVQYNIRNKSKKYFRDERERINFTKSSVNYENGSNNSHKISQNISEVPKLVLIYDISLLSDSIGPLYNNIPPEQIRHNLAQSASGSNLESKVYCNEGLTCILSIDPEGTFIAATSRYHPFLGYLISAACHRMHPKYVIQDTLLAQCANTFNNDMYCNNIYLL